MCLKKKLIEAPKPDLPDLPFRFISTPSTPLAPEDKAKLPPVTVVDDPDDVVEDTPVLA